MARLRTFLDEYWTDGLERLREAAEAASEQGKEHWIMAELVREIVIDARPAIVFAFLVDPQKHLAWLGTEVDLDPQPGGIYRVQVGREHRTAGEFVEVVPNERVVFTFGWEEPGHPIPSGSTTVTITLTPEGEKTRLRLVHRGLPAEAVPGHTGGWDHYLSRLTIVAAGGNPGPDEGPPPS
jgi:uncharacterized protein YndB with AHSA1/START domain